MSADANYTEVARVVAINRYPVKSMAGETVSDAHIGWHGIAGDRRFAFLLEDDTSGLPWLSARETPGALGYASRYATEQDVDRGRAEVITPGGQTLTVRSRELLSEMQQLSGKSTRLVRLHRGCYDAMPLSLVSLSSVASVRTLVGKIVDQRRFRANVVVESFDEHPYPEDRWIGDLLVFGDSPQAARVRVNRRDPRCQVINVNPDSLEIDKSIHKAIIQERKNLCGVYGSTERPGVISVGDIIKRRKH
jgi:uncharacterized protein YcbX